MTNIYRVAAMHQDISIMFAVSSLGLVVSCFSLQDLINPIPALVAWRQAPVHGWKCCQLSDGYDHARAKAVRRRLSRNQSTSRTRRLLRIWTVRYARHPNACILQHPLKLPTY